MHVLILCVLAGKWSVTGFFITRRSFSLPLTPLMLSLCKSCTMSPEKRLNVRGIRTCGFTCGSVSILIWDSGSEDGEEGTDLD